MFIKLTNASPDQEGTTLILKKDNIISVFRSEVEWASDITNNYMLKVAKKDFVTVVFCGTVGSWYVKESPEEVFNLLN